MPPNSLSAKDIKTIKLNSKIQPENSGEYYNLKGSVLAPYMDVEIVRLERLAKILRGLIFSTVENAQSGHPGGSSSKVEQFLALTLGGILAFDPMDPKHPGRDRVIWSAGHCTPLLYSGQALYYEALRRLGRQFSEAVINCVLPEQLLRFRHADGPSGHAESYYPFSDYCTGPSGHGFCAAGGMAISHRSSGLPTRVWVFMGDAESEEGMTYEARNVLAATGTDNIIITLDYNHFGIDGPVEEVMSAPYVNYWRGFGWNVIEAEGHNVNQLLHAYNLAANLKNNRPTVVIAHTLKGKSYGDLENTAASHGSAIEQKKYAALMNELGFAVKGNPKTAAEDLEIILDAVSDSDCEFIEARLNESAKNIEPESELIARMKNKLSGREFTDPLSIRRPKVLPKELVFKAGERVSLREAASAWFEWLMKQTAFFYCGAGDLAKSVLTNKSEHIFGLIKPKNQYGRGIRFGIAEANMAMMSMGITQDVLPGDFHPVSVFGTYGVFSAIYGHAVHLAMIHNQVDPARKGFFVALCTHDGPTTGEDGPTHQGMYWQSLFKAYPGIKVLKPADANEVIEMLFYALEKGEPIVLAMPRGDAPVLSRNEKTPATSACSGAYLYEDYSGIGKKIVLAVCGAPVLENTLLALPKLRKDGFDPKIVVVTSPEIYSELLKTNPEKAGLIISDEERNNIVTLHDGWNGFLDDIFYSSDILQCRQGVDGFLVSGKADEVSAIAGLDTRGIINRVKSIFKQSK